MCSTAGAELRSKNSAVSSLRPSHRSSPLSSSFSQEDLAAAESELRADYRRLEEMGERNYISTTAGLLADVLYRQGRYDESAEFAEVCEHIASPNDVASQFLWRCVRGKLRARQGAIDEAESLLSAAMALIEPSDQLDLQGNGLLDFAEVRELAGAPADAADLSEQSRHALRTQGKRRLGAEGAPARRTPALDASDLVAPIADHSSGDTHGASSARWPSGQARCSAASASHVTRVSPGQRCG